MNKGDWSRNSFGIDKNAIFRDYCILGAWLEGNHLVLHPKVSIGVVQSDVTEIGAPSDAVLQDLNQRYVC